MSNVLAVLVRLFVILLGYIVASLAASAFINILALAALGAEPDDPVATASLMFTVPFMALFVAYFAFLPSLMVILFTELLAKRDWLAHALGGGAVALFIVGFVLSGDTWQIGVSEGPGSYWPPLDDPRMAFVLIGAGLVGGIAYWLIAGRSAGNWREDSPLPPRS